MNSKDASGKSGKTDDSSNNLGKTIKQKRNEKMDSQKLL